MGQQIFTGNTDIAKLPVGTVLRVVAPARDEREESVLEVEEFAGVAGFDDLEADLQDGDYIYDGARGVYGYLMRPSIRLDINVPEDCFLYVEEDNPVVRIADRSVVTRG